MKNIASITRANFLPLTIVIVAAALAAAFYAHRTFNAVDAGLVLVAALLMHASVNAFNNYFDFRSNIDAKTPKTPFSGGVETIVKGLMKPSEALLVSISCLAGAGMIGIYFLLRLFNPLIPLVVYGAIAIVFYTPILSRIHALSEIVAGTGFGFMGLGVYVTQSGVVDATGVAIFVPITILVALLLFLNEFPDADVDKLGGRKHIVILFGKSRSAWIYVAGLVATEISIVIAVMLEAAPFEALVALFAIPIAYKAGRLALKNYDRMPDLVPALGLNVIYILSTISLLAVGFAVGAFL